MAKHVEGMLTMQRKGAITFDYGNNIAPELLKAVARKRFDISGFVPEYIATFSVKVRVPLDGLRCQVILKTSKLQTMQYESYSRIRNIF